MARGKTRKIGKLQRMRNLELAEREAPPVLDPHTARHGDYRDEGNHGRLRAIRNYGGTPVARWKASGALEHCEIAAIDHCIALWERIGKSSGLVMNLAKIPGMPGGDGMREHEALNDITRIKGYFPAMFWNIFENVCRFDEPAGVAGSRLATNKDEHVVAARIAVKFVASVIAHNERLSY